MNTSVNTAPLLTMAPMFYYMPWDLQQFQMVPLAPHMTCQPYLTPFAVETVKSKKRSYAWTEGEDKEIKQHIAKHGEKQWIDLAKRINFKFYGGVMVRKGKQCKERYINHLNEHLNREKWSTDEDILLLKLTIELGRRWAEISRKLSSRTENQAKNRWNSLLRRAKKDIDFTDKSFTQISEELLCWLLKEDLD